MIARLKGLLDSTSADSCVIDVNGVDIRRRVREQDSVDCGLNRVGNRTNVYGERHRIGTT